MGSKSEEIIPFASLLESPERLSGRQEVLSLSLTLPPLVQGEPLAGNSV